MGPLVCRWGNAGSTGFRARQRLCLLPCPKSGLPGGGAGASEEATAPDPRVPRSSPGRGDRGREGSPAPLAPLHGVAAAGFRQPLLRGDPGAPELRTDRRSLPEQLVSVPARDGPGSEGEGGPAPGCGCGVRGAEGGPARGSESGVRPCLRFSWPHPSIRPPAQPFHPRLGRHLPCPLPAPPDAAPCCPRRMSSSQGPNPRGQDADRVAGLLGAAVGSSRGAAPWPQDGSGEHG